MNKVAKNDVNFSGEISLRKAGAPVESNRNHFSSRFALRTATTVAMMRCHFFFPHQKPTVNDDGDELLFSFDALLRVRVYDYDSTLQMTRDGL